MTLASKKIGQLQAERFSDVIDDQKYKAHKDSKVFYVDSNSGSDSYNGLRRSSPKATLAGAYADCTASRGDTIVVMPFHAETTTAVLTVAKAGVRIIGETVEGQRPVITGNGTIDVISLEADGCSVINLEFAAPATDAQTADINIAAAKCLVKGTKHHGSTTALNKVDIITLTAAAHDAVIEDVLIYNDTVECVGGIVLEGACKRVLIKNVIVHDSIGFTNGAISDEATALQLTVDGCIFSNAKANTVVAEFGNNTTGVMRNSYINGRHTTIQSNVTPGTGMVFFEVYGVEEAAKNGLLMPVVDAE